FLKEPARFTGKDVPSICVFEASSLRHEVEMIARRIRALYAEEELHYSDICVLLRSLGGYEKVIEDVFRQYGIPVFIHERKKLVEKGLALTLAAFLKLLTSDWKREDLFYLLRSSFLNSIVVEEGVLELEKTAYAKNIREGREKWASLSSDADVPASAKEALGFAVEWEKKLKSSRSAREAGQVLSGILGLLSKGSGPGADPLAEEIDESLESVLQSGVDFLKSRGGSFSADSFAQFILDSLDAALFSYRPRGRNRVQVYDVIMALPKEYKVVFVAGLLEKSFPQAAQEDPFFKDAERRVMNREKSVLEERGWRAGGERYFFYMAVTRAKEKLYLTYPLYDAEGRPALASFFVSACNKCFGDRLRFIRKGPAEFLPEPSEWASDPDVTRGLAETLFLGPTARKTPRDNGALDLLGGWSSRPDFAETIEWGLRAEEARIVSKDALKLFQDDRAIYSATRLEEYATCAFKHFSKRMLHLMEPARNREFLEKGNLLHKTLELFYGELSRAQKSSLEFWRDEKGVEKLLLKHLDRALESGPFGHEPLYRQRVFKNSLIEALRVFARREGRFFGKRDLVASRFEWAFGMRDVPDSAEALVLRGPAGPVRLQGRIDRIDLTPDGKKAFIVDYKLSAREKRLAQKWSEGLELQIPIYLLAVSRLLGHEVIGAELRFLFSNEDKPAEGFYREADRQTIGLGKKQKGKTEEEWKALLSESETRVQSAAAGIQSGNIAVRSKSCKYCDYSSVCRFEKWRLIYNGGSE
ncbi:MAG TPA: PD-(D/E)XK nuclease family protein, partial [Candidatus Omnitrophota bacterium]|nr:PD-(D/E)XK nuclease family protein [Candidatus Omnitrophota bacterium]